MSIVLVVATYNNNNSNSSTWVYLSAAVSPCYKMGCMALYQPAVVLLLELIVVSSYNFHFH